MLHVRNTEAGPTGKGKELADEDRKINFRYLGAFAMGQILAFRLSINDELFPVLATQDTDDNLVTFKNVSIRGTQYFQDKYGIPGHTYKSPDTEIRILRVAAECLLAYGGYYDGLTTLRGQCRVELADGSYTLQNFSY
jgi:hypothetical protein